MLKELDFRREYLANGIIETIYFGGGTPSILEISELESILEKIHQTFQVNDKAEITIEINPESSSFDKLVNYQRLGFNRLSIGIQTFNDSMLKFMNRNHNNKQALRVMNTIEKIGFENYSMDLIYGIQNGSDSIWYNDLKTALSFNPPHISSYCLAIEKNTVFGKWVKNGKIHDVEDEVGARQYNILVSTLEKAGYDHYEISNFCLPGLESKHNSSYWHGKPYLGIGPGAHSYDGLNRYSNIKNNHEYIRRALIDLPSGENEDLTVVDRINDYILTRIRTKWGVSMDKLNKVKPNVVPNNITLDLEEKGYVTIRDGYIFLTKYGKLFGDYVSECLLIDKI